jgi:hypothetical protein
MLVAPLLTAVTVVAQTPGEPGIRGAVFTHENQPVPSGTVVLETRQPASIINVTIDHSGYFRAVTTRSGLYHLSIAVPGFATHRIDVIVPRSGSIELPPIRLATPTYYHARFVNTDGDTIVSPRLRMRVVDDNAFGIARMIDAGLSRTESDGSTSAGPLPRGVIAMVFDTPGFAQTRLPDMTVTGEESVLDGGTIAIQPGSLLQVEVIDANGAPIANHPVSIEDVRSPSPLALPPARTDPLGRVTFDRLAEGAYRVGSVMTRQCNTSPPLSVVEPVRVSGNGAARARLVLGGTAAVRVRSPLGPLGGVSVSVTPGAGEQLETAVMRPINGPRPVSSSSCAGSTNADGVVSFDNVPAGPFSVGVRLPNSTYLRNVEFRGAGRPTPITIPDGLLSLRVTNAANGRPIANARLIWSGGGYRVMATTTGNGDVLLEGVGEGPGVINAFARGFIDAAAKIAPASGPIEMGMQPLPGPRRQVRVVTKTGEPIEDAIVELLPSTVHDVGVIGVTDAKGVIQFPDVPPREVRAQVRAGNHLPSAITLPADSDAPITVTLAPAPR